MLTYQNRERAVFWAIKRNLRKIYPGRTFSLDASGYPAQPEPRPMAIKVVRPDRELLSPVRVVARAAK